jgi:hypothetical protein
VAVRHSTMDDMGYVHYSDRGAGITVTHLIGRNTPLGALRAPSGMLPASTSTTNVAIATRPFRSRPLVLVELVSYRTLQRPPAIVRVRGAARGGVVHSPGHRPWQVLIRFAARRCRDRPPHGPAGSLGYGARPAAAGARLSSSVCAASVSERG